MSRYEFTTIKTSKEADGLYAIELNRPEVHNAFNEVMIQELAEAIIELSGSDSCRLIVIKGNGRSFCAGADIDWMRRTSQYDEANNLEDARRLANMLDSLYRIPCPTIAQIHGAVYGGGVGLAACCDIAIADANSTFSISEVRLGLIPSIISPYVVQSIGTRNARRYFLTGERFNAQTALKLGLIHEIAAVDQLSQTCDRVVQELLKGGPNAQCEAKSLLRSLVADEIDNTTVQETSKRIAKIRASSEAQEGMSAFFEKRSPNWN